MTRGLGDMEKVREFGLSPDTQHTLNTWIHNAVKEAYTAFGDGVDKNSAGSEHRSLAVKALDFIQIAPYAAYYGSYNVAHALNYEGDHLGFAGSLASHALATPLAALEVLGLGTNEAISCAILAMNNGKANLYEDIEGTIVPHFAWPNAPKVYLPGVHTDGYIDFEW